MPKTKPKSSQRKKLSSVRLRELDSFSVDQRSDYTSLCKWTIPNFSKVKSIELFSPYFQVGAFHFRLRMYPYGTLGLEPGYYLSLGVEIDNTTRNPKMGCFASFNLTLENHLDDSRSVRREWYHRFSARNGTFGWKDFAVYSEILKPRSGFLFNQSLQVRAEVNVLDESMSMGDSSIAEESNASSMVGKFSWKINNFRLFKEMIKTRRILGPSFRIGVFEYRLCLQESFDQGVGYLSLYLESDVTKNVKVGDGNFSSIFGLSESDIMRGVTSRSFWGMFGISVLNQNPELNHMHKKSQGRFGCWGGDDGYLGWRFYMEMSDFVGSEKGFLVDDDMVMFKVTYNVVQEIYYTHFPGNKLASHKFISSFSKCDEETGGFFWEIKNFTCLKDTMKKKKMVGIRVESRNMQMGNEVFRLVVYPRGQSHNPSYISLFLEFSSLQHSRDWSILLHYRLGIVHCGDMSKTIIKQSLRRCYIDTKDLGWWDLVPMAIFFDKNSRYMIEDTAVFFAEVHILKETLTAKDLTESSAKLSHIEYDCKGMLFTWKVENFLSCKEVVTTQKVFSRFFKVAECELRIGVFVSVDCVCVCLESDPSCSSDTDGNFWVSFCIALVNQKDPNKTFWKKSSLCTKTCNNYHLQMMKLSDILEQDAGYIDGDMIIFSCEILDYCPWFEVLETEVLASDDGEGSSLSVFGEPLNSEDIELIGRRKVDVVDCNFSSLSDFGEPENSKGTEVIVKNKVAIFNFKHLISRAVCLLMNEQNNPQPLVILKEELQLDACMLAALLLRLRFHLDDLNNIKFSPHPSTSGPGDLNDVSDKSLPTSKNLTIVIKVLKMKIDDKLIDIMLECCQSTKKKSSLDFCDESSIVSVTTVEAVSQLELQGDIGSLHSFWFNIFGEVGSDKDLQCFDLNIGATLQTILGPLMSQLGIFAQCPSGIKSAGESEAMTEPLELLGFIANLLEPLSATISVTCLGSSQGTQLAGKISYILDCAPMVMQPNVVALLCKLINPLEYPLAACILLNQIEKLDNESVLQPPNFAAINQSHSVRNKLWELSFSQNLAHLAVSNNETLDLVIRLLFRTASLCQHIPQAVRAVRAKLEELSLAVPTCVLKCLGETINSRCEIAEAMLREIYSVFESDDLINHCRQLSSSDNGLEPKRLPLVDKKLFVDHQFSNVYMLIDLLSVPSLSIEAAKAFEKGIANGFIVDHLVKRILERYFMKNLKVDALYSGKYQHENAKDVKEEICYLEDVNFTMLIGLAETLSTSDNPRVSEFVRLFYAILFKLLTAENHRKKLVEGLVDNAIISAQNCQNSMEVLLFLVHEEYDVAKQVLSMMKEASVLAKDVHAALCHQLSAIKVENTHKSEEWQAEISSLKKDKAILLERLSASEATISQYKEQFAKERKKLSEHAEGLQNQLQLFCSEQDDKIEKLLMERKIYQDSLCSAELQLAEFKRQQCTSTKLVVEEKNILAERLRNAQVEIKILDQNLKQCAWEAVLQEKWCRSLLDEILRLQQEVDKSEKERQKKDEEVSYLKAYIEEMRAKLMACQKRIQSFEVALQEDVSTRIGGLTWLQ